MKQGWKTSEFWATAVATLIPLINQAFGLDLPVESIAGITASIAAYVVSRGLAKKVV